MASSSKKKTTFAKITRENAVRERRLRKQARKDTRKAAAAMPDAAIETTLDGAEDVGATDAVAVDATDAVDATAEERARAVPAAD